jgi:hypothetical protein
LPGIAGTRKPHPGAHRQPSIGQIELPRLPRTRYLRLLACPARNPSPRTFFAVTRTLCIPACRILRIRE